MSAALRAVWLIVSTAVRVSPLHSLGCLCEIAGRVWDVLRLLFLSWLVAASIAHDGERMAWAAAGFAGSVGIGLIFDLIGVNARIGQLERVGYAHDARTAGLTAEIPTLDHLLSPRYLDRMQRLREQSGALGLALNTLLNNVNTLVAIGGTLLLAGTADGRLLLVALAGLPPVFASRWTIRWQARAERLSAQPGRLAAHLLDLGLTPGPGAELRVFGLADRLRALHRRAVAGWRGPLAEAARRQATMETCCTLLFHLVAAGVLAWLLADVIAGAVGVGALVLAVMLVGRLQEAGTELQGSASRLSQMVRGAGDMLWLIDHHRRAVREHGGSTAPPPAPGRGVSLDGVSYTYPGADRPALHEVTLDLPAGSVVALVGENGAGKSTLAALLAGLHRPTAGSIRVDGTDLAQLDLAAWRSRVSGAFQDHTDFEFTAGQTVGIGELPHADDTHPANPDLDAPHLDAPERIAPALERGAARELVDALPHGPATVLGPTWPDGIGLSGGQWQRLALARGMMRDRSLLLILDEPTSALDAAAEHALFEHQAEAARRSGSRGGVTLLVTHRFSTVAAADLVVVLERGRVVEQGSHRQLLAAGGSYAELYELQSRGYR